jgi:hypothetical protein
MFLLTHNRNIRGFNNLRLFGTELRLTDQVKYLGVILDKKLDWKAHLENRMHKACIAYWQCRRAVGKTWGLSPRLVAWLYTSVVRSILSYAPLVWWKRVELKNAQKRLSHLQQMTCLGITGCMRSTPTSAVNVATLAFAYKTKGGL